MQTLLQSPLRPQAEHRAEIDQLRPLFARYQELQELAAHYAGHIYRLDIFDYPQPAEEQAGGNMAEEVPDADREESME